MQPKPISMLPLLPVSYTHLDVYKRQIYTCHRAPGKQGRPHRRGDIANTQVHDHHDTEMDGMHAKTFHHREENRRCV